MNKKLFWTLGLALITSLSMQAQDDDLYFTPSKKKSQDMNATVTSVRSNQQSASTQSSRPALAVYNNNSRDEDEYNRRNVNYAGAWQTGGGAEDSLVAQVDTVYVTSPDMYDPEADFIYSRRLLRFHSPRFGFALSSPYYWDLVYGYGVYNYLYDPFYWDLYDPFYWDYGWGYGWSWRPWYSSFYGWYSPYYYNSWYAPRLWGWTYWGPRTTWGIGWGGYYGWYDPGYWHGPAHHYGDYARHGYGTSRYVGGNHGGSRTGLATNRNGRHSTSAAAPGRSGISSRGTGRGGTATTRGGGNMGSRGTSGVTPRSSGSVSRPSSGTRSSGTSYGGSRSSSSSHSSGGSYSGGSRSSGGGSYSGGSHSSGGHSGGSAGGGGRRR